jgi:hypothetical protein
MSNATHKTLEKPFSKRQVLFLKYLTWTLVDLTVLNFFAEYWDKITITSFGVSLFIAITLQALLKMTISLEHRISDYLKSSERLDRKIIHIFSTWFVLFASKFVMLWVLQLLFADSIIFLGAYHGVITFIVLVTVILLAEYLLLRLFEKLA